MLPKHSAHGSTQQMHRGRGPGTNFWKTCLLSSNWVQSVQVPTSTGVQLDQSCAGDKIMSAMLNWVIPALHTSATCATPRCPPGWIQGVGSKCMRLSAPSSHLGCAAACAALDPAGKASLACIQSVADEQLAAIAAPAGLNAQIWLGEYQWPMEPVIDFQTVYDCQVFNTSCDKPYKGQKNWGRCTNGQTTNVTNICTCTCFSHRSSQTT